MFRRRLIFLFLCVIALLGVLAGRLYWLVRIAGVDYDAAVYESYVLSPKWLDTLRGSIYDRHGRMLAVDQASHDLCFHYRFTRLFDPRRRQHLIDQYLGNHQRATVSDAQTYWQAERDEGRRLLKELAVLCETTIPDLESAIARINDKIFNLQTVRARILLCRKYDLEYRRMPHIEAIREEFARLVRSVRELAGNDPNALILREEVAEMRGFVPVLHDVSDDIARLMEEHFASAGDDAAVKIVSSKRRHYPYQEEAAHLLGQVGPIHDDDLSDRPQDRPPDDEELRAYYLGDRKGAWGVERVLEQQLRGRRGWQQLNKKREHVHPPLARELGRDVHLTIDVELQRAVRELFAARDFRGAAIVLNIADGGVLALVSAPSFDLNRYYEPAYYAGLYDPNDLSRRIVHRALSKNYNPGSTVKPALLMGALEKRILSAHTVIDCDRYYKDWVGYPQDIRNDGPMDAVGSIRKSCNFYYIKLAERMGSAAVTQTLQECGWGAPILAWPDGQSTQEARWALRETQGHLAPQGSRRAGLRSLRFISIGRGALDGSILHIANNTATVARNGEYLAPTVLLDPLPPRRHRQVAGPDVARVVQKGMEEAIYHPSGTAFESGIKDLWPRNQVLVHGKTGTAVNSLFCGYAQSSTGTKIALALVLEPIEGVESSGGKVAAPFAREIFRAIATAGYLPPAAALEQEAPAAAPSE